MFTEQMLVKALGLVKTEAERALHLGTALNHALTHAQLSVLDLLHFSHYGLLLQPSHRLVQGIVEEEAMAVIDTLLLLHEIVIDVWSVAPNTC